MGKAVKLANVFTRKAVWTITASEHSVERMQTRERGAALVVAAIKAIGEELASFKKSDEVMIRFPALDMAVIIGFMCATPNMAQVITVIEKGNAYAKAGTTIRVAA
jgi:hypothetical protein